ncbi:hypothetical protein Pfo_010515 [Paulownia fortunei]|nr:hypothetical protein Pfo_010515 [Paulownia fortunei]
MTQFVNAGKLFEAQIILFTNVVKVDKLTVAGDNGTKLTSLSCFKLSSGAHHRAFRLLFPLFIYFVSKRFYCQPSSPFLLFPLSPHFTKVLILSISYCEVNPTGASLTGIEQLDFDILNLDP